MGINRELLHNTLSIQSKSGKTEHMQKYLKRFAKKHGIDFRNEDGNIYMVKGEAETYPCIVAHTDTVHAIIDNFVVTVKNGIYQGKNRDTGDVSGVGGDDKVGITVALQALLTFPVMKAAFFRDEEQGCVGSRKADMTFFDDCTLVIQADRRGNDDVTASIMGTPMMGEEFATELAPFLDAYGFSFCDGGMTDVWQLRQRGLAVCGFNMSAGYHMPHTKNETVNVADVDKTWNFIEHVITELGGKVWPFEYFPDSEFSLFEEEQEEDEDDESPLDFLFLPAHVSRRERGVGMHAAGWDGDCPLCGGVRLTFDDTLELNFCLDCCEYVILPDTDDENEDFLFGLEFEDDEEEDIDATILRELEEDEREADLDRLLSQFTDGHGNPLRRGIEPFDTWLKSRERV